MRYNAERDQIEISVRELCDAALSRGSIDSRRSHRNLYERARAGGEIHRKLQNSFGAIYHAEVELRHVCKLDDVYFCVSGRADGIICRDGVYTVDEIKTVSEKQFKSEETDIFHLSQLYCYAYFLCRTKEIAGVNTRIVYYNIEDGEIEYRERYVSESELKVFYMKLVSAVAWRGEFMQKREKLRMANARTAPFPYSSLRDSQTEMIKECYRDIKHGTRLFCQAPTGIGKTISTLYPSVKCLGEGIANKVFYLTGKASIKREAYAAVEKMNRAGSDIFGIVLSAKEQMCACENAKAMGGRLSSYCNPEFCPYAKGYYDKIDGILQRMIGERAIFDSAYIKKVAKEEGVCPYELSLDLSELCDVIICDYNYVFSPLVYLKRYFEENKNHEKYIFLVDEAHNLPDRAREMFSSRLTTNDFEEIISLAGEDSKLTEAALSMIKSFESLETLCHDNMNYDADGRGAGYYIAREMPENFVKAVAEFSNKCEGWMKYNEGHIAFKKAEELGAKIYEFKKICECFDNRYLTFVNTGGGKTSLLLYCLDPSHNLSIALERAVATVMFSATLTPTEYFADVLGGGDRAVSVSFESPFPKENLAVAIMDGVSTRYEDREASYKKISSCIAATLSAKSGNYMAFFPSYKYMEEVLKIFTKKYPKVRVLAQKKNMSAREKEEFLNSFADDGKLRVGFCVLGGSFSEGIDLPGDRLIGVLVVGVGLPGISDENNIIRDYYEDKCGSGYDYAYTYPGMNSVLQAVGRVIRTEHDRGVAVLIDDRYSEQKYREMFPEEWKGANLVGDGRSLAEFARRFWQK